MDETPETLHAEIVAGVLKIGRTPLADGFGPDYDLASHHDSLRWDASRIDELIDLLVELREAEDSA